MALFEGPILSEMRNILVARHISPGYKSSIPKILSYFEFKLTERKHSVLKFKRTPTTSIVEAMSVEGRRNYKPPHLIIFRSKQRLAHFGLVFSPAIF